MFCSSNKSNGTNGMFIKKRAKCADFTYYSEVSYNFDEVTKYLCRLFPDLSYSEVSELTIVICNPHADTGLLSFESVTRSEDGTLFERVIIRPYRMKYLHKDNDTICLWWRSYSSHFQIIHES